MKKRIRKLATILALAMLLAIPVQARKVEEGTNEQIYSKYYRKNPVYQRGNDVVFVKQRLIVKNARLDKKRHMVLCGTKVLQDYMFNRRHVVSFYCYPGGSAARYLPGRGARDHFVGLCGRGKYSLDGWTIGQKTLKRKNGHRTAIRIDLYGGQYLKLSRHGRKHHYWWWLEDYFK